MFVITGCLIILLIPPTLAANSASSSYVKSSPEFSLALIFHPKVLSSFALAILNSEPKVFRSPPHIETALPV